MRVKPISFIASEAKQSTAQKSWIASSLLLLAMTEKQRAGIAPGPSVVGIPRTLRSAPPFCGVVRC